MWVCVFRLQSETGRRREPVWLSSALKTSIVCWRKLKLSWWRPFQIWTSLQSRSRNRLSQPKPQLSSLPAPGSTSSTPSLTPEHKPSKTPPKPPSKDGIPRRGSGEVTLSLLLDLQKLPYLGYIVLWFDWSLDKWICYWLIWLIDQGSWLYHGIVQRSCPNLHPLLLQRRSFPSGLGLTTNSSGEVITINKSVKVNHNSQKPSIFVKKPYFY